jgi:signal transduction histidine kinase/CheY-like chemotaxis protein
MMAKTNILIVEDELIVAMDLKDALERMGYIVPAIVDSGELAIQKASELLPDLVLMDVALKGEMDGIEAAERIWARHQIPVVFSTACTDELILQRAKQIGPFGYILKPFQDRVLQTTLEMALYKSQTEREIRQYNHQLITLQSAGAVIGFGSDLRRILKTLTWQTARLLDADACATFKWDGDSDSITLLAHFGANGRWNTSSSSKLSDLVTYPVIKRALLEKRSQQIRTSQPGLDPNDLSYLQTANVKTVAILPMLFKDQIFGFIEISDRDERIFTDQEITLAQLLSNHAASAVENSRLYSQVRQRVEELTTLNEIGQAITSSLDLEETLTIVTAHAVRLLNAEAASIALQNGSAEDIEFVAASGQASDFVLGKRLATNQGIAGWVMQTGNPLLVTDVSQDSHFYSGFDQESGFDTQSVLCVPLQTKGRTIGIIEALNKRESSFDQSDLRLLNSMAAPAATAIENARLYQRAQQEIAERSRAEAALEAERASLAERVAERTAELRQANADLEEANQLKDRFVSNVSHELRTPLSVITLLTGNLEMWYDRWGEDKRRQTIREIRVQSRLLNDLIESVLEMSRIDGNRISSEQCQLDLVQLAREETEKQKPLAQKKSQRLKIVGVRHLPVQGDDSQLRQIIRNLLNNAIKYTPIGGEITCDCRIIDQQRAPDPKCPGSLTLPAGRWAVLRVVDTGIGISQENLPRLFERFYRVNEQGNIPGVGLGLSIAKELVERHAGTITVTSTPGNGSTFAIYLPLCEE